MVWKIRRKDFIQSPMLDEVQPTDYATAADAWDVIKVDAMDYADTAISQPGDQGFKLRAYKNPSISEFRMVFQDQKTGTEGIQWIIFEQP